MKVVPRRGTVVVIEGIDAVGKKTQSSLLVSALKSRGLRTSTMSFPAYETKIGNEIREYFRGMREYPREAIHLLLAANRWEKKTQVETLVSKNDVLVINRYSPSNLAYGVANGLDLGWLQNLETGLPRADLVCVLDAPPLALAARRGGRRKDRFEKDDELQAATRREYLKLAPRYGWIVVPATHGIQDTAASLYSVVEKAVLD